MTTTTQTPVTLDSMDTLTGLDRCDRCSAQAYVRVTLPSSTNLLFCGHHYREHEPVFLERGDRIHDERHKLEPAPVPVEVDAK